MATVVTLPLPRLLGDKKLPLLPCAVEGLNTTLVLLWLPLLLKEVTLMSSVSFQGQSWGGDMGEGSANGLSEGDLRRHR